MTARPVNTRAWTRLRPAAPPGCGPGPRVSRGGRGTIRRRADDGAARARYGAHLLAAIAMVGAYLLGSIPFGLLIARTFAQVDVRGAGSGNIGATNVARTAGKKLGIATLLLDAGKGALAVVLARALDLELPWVCGAAALAVLGHVFPVWLRFAGGKGVATAAGVFLALAPLATGVAVVVFALAFAVGRVVSVASLLGSLALLGALVLLDGRTPVWVTGVGLVALIFARHAGNLSRLVRGQESKL